MKNNGNDQSEVLKIESLCSQTSLENGHGKPMIPKGRNPIGKRNISRVRRMEFLQFGMLLCRKKQSEMKPTGKARDRMEDILYIYRERESDRSIYFLINIFSVEAYKVKIKKSKN